MDVDRLRAEILRLRLQGLRPDEIARELRCSRSTVFKQLKRPSGDRRARPRRNPAALAPTVRAEVERFAAYPTISPDRALAILQSKRAAGLVEGRLPSRSTVARALRALRHESEPDPELVLDPYLDLARPDYDLARRTDLASGEPEIALVRALLRETLRHLDAADPHDARAILRIRAQIVQLLAVLNRVRRGAPSRDERFERLAEFLGTIETEATGPR
jgi:hypothetical protein